MAEFAKIFKQLRLERELSQSRLAEQLGISKSAVNMYERGDRRPDFETAEAIADFFNVDMNYLLGYSDKITRLSGDHTDPASGARAAVLEPRRSSCCGTMSSSELPYKAKEPRRVPGLSVTIMLL